MNESVKKIARAPINPTVYLRSLSEEAVTVAVVVALFVVASSWLFFQINRELDPNDGKNWWTLAFESRDAGSLSFAIENHSASTTFTYSVSHDKDIIDSGDMTLEKGGRKTISPPTNAAAGRTIVTVTASDGSKKEIYRDR
jgi:hypothetical protein